MTIDTPNGLDLDMFQEMQELMEEDFPLLLQTYLDDTPLLLEQINNANSTVDAASLAAAAHQLKSTSASLGFALLETLAEELETIGNGGDGVDGSEAPALYEKALANYNETKPFICKHL